MKKLSLLFITSLFALVATISLPTQAQSADETFFCGFKVLSNVVNPKVIADSFLRMFGTSYFNSDGYECEVTGFPKETRNGKTVIIAPDNCILIDGDKTHVWCNGQPYGYSCDDGKFVGVINTGNLWCKSRTTPPPAPVREAAKPLPYQPLEPLPGLENASNLDFASLVGAVIRLFITIGALLAVATLAWGGAEYMLTGAFEQKSKAKKRIRAALFGLLIVIGAWLILNTINPALVKFGSIEQGLTSNSTGGASKTTTTPTKTTIPGQRYAANSSVGISVSSSAQFKEKGYTALIDVNGVAVVVASKADIEKADFIDYTNRFASGCWEKGGDVEVAESSSRTAYYCATNITFRTGGTF